MSSDPGNDAATGNDVWAVVQELMAVNVKLDRLIELLTPPTAAPQAHLEVPERCRSFDASLCAMQSDEARISKAAFGDPQAWACKGCRVRYSSIT